MPRKRVRKKSLDDKIKIFIGEMGYRLIKIGLIACVGGASNYIIHEWTESKVIGLIATGLVTGAAASKKM